MPAPTLTAPPAHSSAPRPALRSAAPRLRPRRRLTPIARTVLPALAFAFTVACSDASPEHACTLVGTAPGIALEVRDPLASQVADAQARTCWNGACQDRSVPLTPSTGVGATTCSGDVCAASSTPRPAKDGFITLPGITETPVQLTLVLRDVSGTQLAAHDITVTPKVSYPNGRDCPPGSPQAVVLVTPEGITAR